jgi:flagellar basal-body rod modification protein FlgD
MIINSTSSVGSTTTGANTSSVTGAGGLGQDAFLKLLVTQLQHQDPSKPLEDKEFIAQLATFTSVEKLSTISAQVAAIGQLLLESSLSTTRNSSNGGL